MKNAALNRKQRREVVKGSEGVRDTNREIRMKRSSRRSGLSDEAVPRLTLH